MKSEYYRKLKETGTKNAEWTVVIAWRDSEERKYDELTYLDFYSNDIKEIPAMVEIMRDAGEETFTVCEQSTALMEIIHKFVEAGCTMKETVTKTYTTRWGETRTDLGIRFSL